MGWPKGKPRPWLKGRRPPRKGEKVTFMPAMPQSLKVNNGPIQFAGKWVMRNLGDGITIYASFDTWKQFFTKRNVHTQVSAEITLEDGTKKYIRDCQELDPKIVKAVFISRKVDPGWINDPKSKLLLGNVRECVKVCDASGGTTSLNTQEPASAA